MLSGFFFQAEDGIRDLVRSRGLGDVYKRQGEGLGPDGLDRPSQGRRGAVKVAAKAATDGPVDGCLLYTSDAADERSSVDLGGRRIIKKKTRVDPEVRATSEQILSALAQYGVAHRE